MTLARPRNLLAERKRVSDYVDWSNEKLADALDVIANRDAITQEAARRLRPAAAKYRPNFAISQRASSTEEWQREHGIGDAGDE